MTKPRTAGTRLLLVSLLFALLPIQSGCAFHPWPKSGVPGNTPEERVKNAQEAAKKKPEAANPRKDELLTVNQAIAELLAEADKARDKGQIDEAIALYDRAIALEPNNTRAISGKAGIARERRHEDKLKEASMHLAKKNVDSAYGMVRQILIETPKHAGALKLQEEIRAQKEAGRYEPPKLKPPFNKPVTLEFRDVKIKMLFEALSKSTGINFILDKDIKEDTKATVFINKAPIEDAIEMVLATNGLQKKALTETSALVYPNTAQKIKDYKELMVRSFYLTNTTAKQMSNTLKTILKVKDVVADDRLNMVVVRDTPEVVRIAEKLINANDLPDPEVMLEIEVLEISKTRLQTLGVSLPTQLNTFDGRSTALTLEKLLAGGIGRGEASLNGAPGLDFKKTLGDVNLISNPRIRVRNNDKAKIQVGDKVPVITTTVTTGVSAVSAQTVNYIDVGLKLEVEPRITLDDNVNIKVVLEVNSLGRETPLSNGGIVYQVGTRNASTVLRLKNGETQILGGLISDDERKSASKLPGLGDVPLVGRLFGTDTDQKTKTEIVLAITPRIVSNISRPDAEVSEFWSGTETGITDRPQINVPLSGGRAAGAVAPAPLPDQPLIPEEPVALPPAETADSNNDRSGGAPAAGSTSSGSDPYSATPGTTPGSNSGTTPATDSSGTSTIP